MYILYESTTTDADEMMYFHNWDAMGMVESEDEAMAWRDRNPKFRRYKYCRKDMPLMS